MIFLILRNLNMINMLLTSQIKSRKEGQVDKGVVPENIEIIAVLCLALHAVLRLKTGLGL